MDDRTIYRDKGTDFRPPPDNSRSPLTGIFGESDAGGRFGNNAETFRMDGLIVRGMSDTPVIIVIKDDKVYIEPAGDLWGKDTFPYRRTNEGKIRTFM